MDKMRNAYSESLYSLWKCPTLELIIFNFLSLSGNFTHLFPALSHNTILNGLSGLTKSFYNLCISIFNIIVVLNIGSCSFGMFPFVVKFDKKCRLNIQKILNCILNYSFLFPVKVVYGINRRIIQYGNHKFVTVFISSERGFKELL